MHFYLGYLCPNCGERLNIEDEVFIDDFGGVFACEYCLRDIYDTRFENWKEGFDTQSAGEAEWDRLCADTEGACT